jgi:26S proteasome regulatory subunit N11
MDGLSAQLMRQLGMGGEEAGADVPVADTAETIYISSLALLKMLKHGSFA